MKFMNWMDCRPAMVAFGLRGAGGGSAAANAVAFASGAAVTGGSLGDPAVSFLRTAGRTQAGDGGGALYRRSASEPAHDGKLQSADGSWWELVPETGQIPVEAFGAIADSTEHVNGTDNSASIQAAIDYGAAVGAAVLIAPPEGAAFGISQVSIKRATRLVGPTMYREAIIGLDTNATITGGSTSGELLREVTFENLFVHNPNGGDAVSLTFCPDMQINNCYFRSSGTTARRGLNMRNCERANVNGFRGGGNPAWRMAKDCNGVTGNGVIISGGDLGVALEITGCQQVRVDPVIETSLIGIRIGDNNDRGTQGDNSAEGGWSSAIDLSGTYMESVAHPIIAGEGFAVNGLNLNDCWLNNGALADDIPFPTAPEILRIGRVKNLRLFGGRWIGSGDEVALSLVEGVPPSGTAPRMLESANMDLTSFESIGSLITHSGIASTADKATIAATNVVRLDDFGHGLGQRIEYTTPLLHANQTWGTHQLSHDFDMGGRITKIELIEGDGGPMTGLHLRVGTDVNIGEILDKTFSGLSPSFEDQGVTDGLIRPGSNLRIRADAGTGTGTFRIRLCCIAGTT